MGYIFSFALLLCIIASTNGACVCPTGYQTLNVDNYCYKFHSDYKTFTGAELSCQAEQNGSHLPSIHDVFLNQAFNSFLTFNTGNPAQTVWFGLHVSDFTNFSLNSSWTWTDGSRVDYQKWCATNPTLTYGCATFQTTVNTACQASWTNTITKCDGLNQYVCKVLGQNCDNITSASEMGQNQLDLNKIRADLKKLENDFNIKK